MPTTTEFRTIYLGPYGGDIPTYTFPVSVSPPIKTGRTKVFPGHATLGPTDPNVDDTLTTLNFMDISGGAGVYTINPASDLNSYWYGVAECEGTDGWTMAREPIMAQPASFSGNHVPLGRIGASTYGLWGTHIHKWDPDTQGWGASLDTVGTVVNTEGIAYFNEKMFFPLGSSGYSYVSESAPGTLGAVTTVVGAATPTYTANATPTTNPKVQLFVVYKDLLWAITTNDEGYALVGSPTGLTGTWQWSLVADTSIGDYVKIEKSFEPKTAVAFPNAQQTMSLWVSGRRGLKVYGDGQGSMRFIDTNFSNVPPHPDMGRALQVFRPGEALWITSGGGDLVQYTVGGAVVPASGPGGQKEGVPGGKRGSVISMATDLFHLYALMQGETAAGTSASIVEDTEGSDALYVPGATATTTVWANTGKGWHPKWESAIPGGTPTKIVVSDATTTTGGTDYRVFWGLGEESWSMQCRLATHSSRQAIQTETGERFRSTLSRTGYQESSIEWGRFNAGSIAIHKLASHAALLMESATATEYVEYQWYNDHGSDGTWETLGVADSDQEDGEPRTVLPFGLTGDSLFSEGEPFHWIRQRLRLVSSNATKPPIVTAMSLSYLPITQDAATKAYTIPLPVDRDEKTTKTAEQIVNTLESLLSPTLGDEKFLLLQDGQRRYRAFISSISYARAPTPDAMGALNLTVIQIPTGAGGALVGEGVAETN
jgi:hypothetical protein